MSRYDISFHLPDSHHRRFPLDKRRMIAMAIPNTTTLSDRDTSIASFASLSSVITIVLEILQVRTIQRFAGIIISRYLIGKKEVGRK